MPAQPNLTWTPRPLALLAVPAFIFAVTQTAFAEDTVTLPSVNVTAEAVGSGAVSTSTGPSTVYQVDEAGIDLWGDAGGSNPYRTVSGMPSVNVQSADSYGLANIPGGNKGMRVRGELATHGANGTIDGVPTANIDPGPGYLWLYDTENFASVSLAQGPVAPDYLGYFTLSGALNTNLRWPTAERNLQVSQAIGSFDFTRSFARYDSGLLKDGTAFFVSGSHTAASKWRGPGDSPEGSDNFEAALSRPLGDHVDLKVYAAYTDMKQDDYRALTYAQATNLDVYRDYDFSSTSSATPSTAINYYGYNRQDFRDWSLLSELTWKISGDSKFVFKPYYQKEQGYYLDGMSNGKVRDWLIDHDWYGLTAEYLTKLNDTNLKLGYWWSSMVPPGPPTAWKMYTPTAAGDLSGAATWSILSKVVDRHQFNSVYAMADQRFNALQVQGGLRFVKETMPGFDFYNMTGIGDVSYDQAIAQSTGVVAERSASSFSVDKYLPFLALAYDLTPAATLKASAGRNFGAPSIDIWPVYQQNYSVFHAQGITANQLWKQIKPETSNAFDLGLRLNYTQGWFEPTLYYARFHDKNVSYDPDGSGPLPAYSQNVGESRSYGAQAAGSWSPLANLDVFGSLSYDHNTFVENLPLNSGATLAVTGLQLPDVPLWSASLGSAWHSGPYTVSPVFHYMSSRYGDTQHTQKIAGYVTADLGVDYKHKFAGTKLDATLSVANLFDRKYIGFINASYYQLMSGTSAIYYPGAPRSIVAKVSLNF
jgi:iron complex outermembrane receptor protein